MSSTSPTEVDAFLLSREWRDRGGSAELVLWASAADGPVRARIVDVEAVMFVRRDVAARSDRRAPTELVTPGGQPVDALYFRTQRALVTERDRLRSLGHTAFESDVKPAERFLMERFITGDLKLRGASTAQDGVRRFDSPTVATTTSSVSLSLLALDLETDDLDGPILSAAVATSEVEHVFIVGAGADTDTIEFVADERSLLLKLFAKIRSIDPDLVVGWNVLEFDLTVLQMRARACDVELQIGRADEVAYVLPRSPGGISLARIPGRVALDGIATLRAATHRFDSYTLEYVANEVLGRGKKIADVEDVVAEIRRLHAEEPLALAAYNLEDCRLVLALFERLRLVEFLVERARLTGLALDRQGGSVAAFDHLYLPRLHRKGLVAHDVTHAIEAVASPGGYVLESMPGLYRDIVAFDFRSLYPSIIRTYRIDPLGLLRPGQAPLPGEDGATFARDESGSILPGIIATLHEARSRAMAEKNDALSRAIKILMSSFYGVLGTPGCRFFDARLATSITRRGHAVIERARAFFVERRLRVIYGDTDSLFVEGVTSDATSLRSAAQALAAELTRQLADEVRASLGVESHLELRVDAHYARFLMPTTRDAGRGAKKRYAGLVRDHDGAHLVIRGLEAVRTDWTPLARRVQRELLLRVFNDEPYEAWLESVTSDLLRGKLDDELGDFGASYPAFVAKQLAPACDVVLGLLGTKFERVAGLQRTLF